MIQLALEFNALRKVEAAARELLLALIELDEVRGKERDELGVGGAEERGNSDLPELR